VHLVEVHSNSVPGWRDAENGRGESGQCGLPGFPKPWRSARTAISQQATRTACIAAWPAGRSTCLGACQGVNCPVSGYTLSKTATKVSKCGHKVRQCHREQVASVVHRSHLLKSWEETETCAVSRQGAHGPKNPAVTRMPVPRSATESHTLFWPHRSRMTRWPST